MNNPFEVIEARLSSIENLILDLKHNPQKAENKEQTQGEAFLSIDQAAELLHLSKATLYSKCSRNEISYFKRGKRLYFSKEKLVQFIVDGNRKTIDEIKNESASYLKKKGGDNE